MGHTRQYILPSRFTLHHPPSLSPHSSVFHSSLSGPDGSDCLPLQPHFSTSPQKTTFLLSFSPWLHSFMTPHGFCHSVVSGKQRNTKPSLNFTRQRKFAAVRADSGNTNRPFSASSSSFLFIFHTLFICLAQI